MSETEAEPGPSAPPALKLYDVHVDEFRAVTQADVDQLCEVARAYGALKTAVEQVHAEHRKNIAEIRSKHGMPA